MTADEAEEIYALRLAIEPAAVGLAALAATDEERAAAVAAMQALDQRPAPRPNRWPCATANSTSR
jgi:DNA-binding GntR family transcriptional regulator